MTRADRRAVAQRLPYSYLEHLSHNERCPAMDRAEAKREMRRRAKAEAAWFANFMEQVVARS